MKCIAVVVFSTVAASAQQPKPSTLKPLPSDMNCEKVTGDNVAVPATEMLIKRGTEYYLCRPKTETTLTKAHTAAISVRSTQTITCGDGSTNDCLREDTKTKNEIEQSVDGTDLWMYFQKVSPSKADIIFRFTADNRASSSAQIVLQVQDSDSGAWLYYEARNITDIENDVNRLVAHVIAKTERPPLLSKAEIEKARQCARAADQLNALQTVYQIKRDDFNFKNNHQLDAQMEECKLHWKDYVCLERGGGLYATQWAESGEEMRRKLQLQFEELREMEQQLATLRASLCTGP